MNKILICFFVFLTVAVVVGISVGLTALFAWALLACMQGMGFIETYGSTQIWWGTGMLYLLSFIIRGSTTSLSSKDS